MTSQNRILLPLKRNRFGRRVSAWMTPQRRILLPLMAALVIGLALLWFLPLDPTLIVARFLALATIVHLMWRYHRLADWSTVEIGRSTMAIKGSILVLAVAANLRTLDDYTALSVHAAAEVGIALGWICVAASLIRRDRLVVKLQGEARALPVPPPPNKLPSEEVKEDR